MLQGIRKRRKKLAIAVGTMAAAVVLWLLFPPAIHGRLKAIRRMQSLADSHMVRFLKANQDQPNAHTNLPLEFDANRYFEQFDRLRMDDGYLLDYVYFADAGGAEPLLYARMKTGPRLPDYAAFYEAFGNKAPQRKHAGAWLDRIRTDGSRQGFIQLAVFYIVADQFYQYWHAHYNDTKVLSRIPAWVVFSDQEVSVSLFTFTKWGGVVCYTIRMKRSFPHDFLSEQKTTVIHYSCGYRY